VELASHEEAGRQWAAERQAIKAEEDRLRQTLRTVNETIAAERGRLAKLEEELEAVRREREQATAARDLAATDRDRARQAVEVAEREVAGVRESLQGRHAELSEQSNKLASDWGARRQALAAEIHAQNEEMQQVRKALQESQERERHGVGTGPMTIPIAGLSIEQSHLINSRLNALVGF